MKNKMVKRDKMVSVLNSTDKMLNVLNSTYIKSVSLTMEEAFGGL